MVFGTFGTTIGGIIGIKFKNPSQKFLSFILAFASGLMIAIVCFDLLPEAFGLATLEAVFLGIILGIIVMIICDILVDKKFISQVNKRKNEVNIKRNSIGTNKNKMNIYKNQLLKTGIIVSVGLALHNFPEGLAIRLWIWCIFEIRIIACNCYMSS